jgi:hypothetical protein
VVAFRARIADTRRELAQVEKQLKTITEDQARVRANLKEVPPTSAAYKRYLEKFGLSTTDLVRRVQVNHRACWNPPPVPGCVCSEWEVVEDDWETLPPDAVSRHMTPDPVMVAPTTPIGDVAQLMVDARIHRLIVADAERRPIGIVASTDVVAALARAARQQR